jgi:threonine dehydrogenase-like Zn-dependent dehydrogenase
VKAVIYEDVGRVRVGDVPDPAIEDQRDAIVRVTAAGICGSDLHFVSGKAPLSRGTRWVTRPSASSRTWARG